MKHTSRARRVFFDNDDVTRRAFAAYFRSGGTDQPANDSGVEKVNGKFYVVLSNVRGILAVYRVSNNGSLKRLKRHPKALNSCRQYWRLPKTNE
jgi:hypothetical protein